MSGKVVEIGSNGIGEESELLKLRISCADAKNLEGPVDLIYHFIGLSFGRSLIGIAVYLYQVGFCGSLTDG